MSGVVSGIVSGIVSGVVRRRAPHLAAVALVAAAYGAARPPRVDAAARAALASRFVLTRVGLDAAVGAPAGPTRRRRPVSPRLEHIAGWISSVGAGAALGDVDGDGLANDVCLVDPRTDAVTVAPVPGVPGAGRYPAFALPQGPLADRTMAPMGCLLADVNEDGRADAVVYYWGRPPLAFLRAGRAVGPRADDFRAVPLVPGDERWFTNAATFADVDGDGHADLVVGNYFDDGARVLDPRDPGGEHMQHSMSRAYNAGRNRVLLWAGAAPGGLLGTPPGARFRDAPDVFPEDVARGWTLAVGAQDLDGDLRPELYFANDFGPDRLLVNRSAPGRPRFVLAAGRRALAVPRSKTLGRDSFKGMGVDFGDLAGDGGVGLFVSNIAQPYALEESHFAWVPTGDARAVAAALARGVAPYADRSEALGLARSAWAWDAKLVDLDGDGAPEVVQATGFVRGTANRWPELQELATANDELLARPGAWPRFGAGDDLSGRTRNPLWTRMPNGRFVDVAPAVGFGEAAVSRGVAAADVDGDGDEDLVVANQWGESSLWRNDGPGPGRPRPAFLGLHLLLPLGASGAATAEHAGHPRLFEGRPALGAEARVLRDGRPPLAAQVDGGNGHSGKRAPELLFGLGAPAAGMPNSDEPAAGAPVRVALRWRDGDGRPHAETRTLAPGWHTLVLAWPAGAPAPR